ncbi:hypothetical protein [uncultured Polaribacter sp.]|uniref:hypothetical protein n=1 Tax=uncultured Polaribacter sp. TaxID=174711 RepID=UPI002605699E|nr:hypothetical protein [uncultured Polaribacter sp.]
MKKSFLVSVFAFFLLVSCIDEDSFPQIETITEGKKWTLEMGSSPSEVYTQLQEFNLEKNFNTVAIAYRQPYSSPEEIKSDISLYNSISLQTTSGVLERVLISFDQDKVSAIEKGGGLLDPIQYWPENQPNDISIHVDDPLEIIQQKLIAIYQISTYQEYQIILPDKLLAKSYDPEMKNYEEWLFVFSESISSLREGRTYVRLYFKNEKLVKIRTEYEEFDFVI